MSDEIKIQCDKLKSEVSTWPRDQKASFIDGISDGLCLAVSIAKESGMNLATNPYLRDLVNWLNDEKRPPVRRRNKAVQKPKCARDQLVDDIKDLLRRAIASRLRIPKNTYDTSLDAWEDVNKYLSTVVAIGNRKALDDSINDLRIVRSITGGGLVDRESVKSEVETCYERFRTEVDAVTRFNEMLNGGIIKVNDVWIWLRSNVHVNSGYDDDELREIDARYQ